MKLPLDLPPDARARIMRSKIDAAGILEKGKKKLPTTIGDGTRTAAIASLIQSYILRVMASFTHELCITGWTVERIDGEVVAFIENLLVETMTEHDSPSFVFPGVFSRMNGKVVPEIWEGFRASAEWATYQAELRSVAEMQATPNHTPDVARDVGGAEKTAIDFAAGFPRRAAWLRERLRERAWDIGDPWRQGGPDRKTVKKILDGGSVREDVLEKLAHALSKKCSKVDLLGIPSD